MGHTILKKIINYILRFLQLQLFLSLMALPILLCWGLPLSLLSPIGNLIFAPILTLFLLFSSLLFFTQLLHIPNGWLAWALELITNIWLYCMQADSHPWLFGFAKPSTFFLILIPILAIVIVHLKHIKNMLHSVACLSLLLIGSCFYIKWVYTKTHDIQTLDCNRGQLHIVHENKQLVVIDPGVIGQRISAPSWIEYTLIPHLIKTSGKTTINHLVLLQPGAVLFEAIATLCEKIKVKNIYLICWQGSLTRHEWAKFFAMKRICKEAGTQIHRIGYKEITLELSPYNKINITPLKDMISQKEITYPAIKVHCKIGENLSEIYSYKFKNAKIE